MAHTYTPFIGSVKTPSAENDLENPRKGRVLFMSLGNFDGSQ